MLSLESESEKPLQQLSHAVIVPKVFANSSSDKCSSVLETMNCKVCERSGNLSFSKMFSSPSLSVVLHLHNKMFSFSKHFPLFPSPSFFSFTDQMFSFSKSFPTPQKILLHMVFFLHFFPLQICFPSFPSPFFVFKKDKTFSILSFSIILMLFSSPHQKSKKSGSKSRISSETCLGNLNF